VDVVDPRLISSTDTINRLANNYAYPHGFTIHGVWLFCDSLSAPAVIAYR